MTSRDDVNTSKSTTWQRVDRGYVKRANTETEFPYNQQIYPDTDEKQIRIFPAIGYVSYRISRQVVDQTFSEVNPCFLFFTVSPAFLYRQCPRHTIAVQLPPQMAYSSAHSLPAGERVPVNERRVSYNVKLCFTRDCLRLPWQSRHIDAKRSQWF